ncbi:ATPase, T2SS/T4P/T4SS family [Sinorhizobium fredii]|uniref:ATPase, T2SS/T4P/T4SS family n=1 Tax=Rhizobium fredii TaxID=380 RepID=UPI0033992FF3
MSAAVSHAMAEFVILTGALGSGKTTLLSQYLSTADTRDTGVIVNDAGEINVDGAVIESDHRDLAMAKLSSRLRLLFDGKRSSGRDR